MEMKTSSAMAADNIRVLTLSMVEKAKSGHPGGAMGGADFAHILFSEFMVYNPNEPQWIARDRFFLDPGHMSPMLYATLALTGKYSMEELQEFRQWGSVTPGHPELDVARGVENTSGPLGQGHAYAVGAAIAAKYMKAHFGEVMRQKIYAFISDGGVQEEISQGAGRMAGHFGLDNLIMFYDANNVQLSTTVKEVTSEDVAAKYKAWGWHVIDINGNDHDQIRAALREANATTGKPTLIIGRTIMGKGAVGPEGVSFENKVSTHGQPLSAAGADVPATITGLGGDSENPFRIFPEVEALYAKRKEELIALSEDWKKSFATWEQAEPELAKKLSQWCSGKAPEVNWEEIEQKPDQATRTASATVLSYLAQHVENMMVTSADLSNSDKTDGFLKKSTTFSRDNYKGAFIQSGVAELTMACICNGIALHGGLIAACGTFFVFSDYMKPAVRLAALMELPVKYVWTHDAFRVGEDGPTHEPVEQEAQIRLLEKLKNHSGQNALLALRPADVHETTVAWELAMNNTKTPTALILSRQNIKNLPDSDYAKARRTALGAYTLIGHQSPDIILLASGSEVSTLVEGAELLEAEGIHANVVSVPSEGVFMNQNDSYRQEVLPPNVPRFGLTAGLPVTLEGLVGAHGTVWGLNSFGFSAPYKVLDEKLGFTAQNVYTQVKNLLGK
ncbi:transketolase family protein [Porphyromonas canoris]|uniref:transketolase family protein n=1 Tax=Porphyromonas canoris TaxID=36875 RepID=UPI000A97C4E2|nr:transketolase [Porphyromonas canoris]